MFMELLQMALAIGLFAVGLLMLMMIHLAQSGKTLRLAPPVWTRWAAALLMVAMVAAACQPVVSNPAPTEIGVETRSVQCVDFYLPKFCGYPQILKISTY